MKEPLGVPLFPSVALYSLADGLSPFRTLFENRRESRSQLPSSEAFESDFSPFPNDDKEHKEKELRVAGRGETPLLNFPSPSAWLVRRLITVIIRAPCHPKKHIPNKAVRLYIKTFSSTRGRSEETQNKSNQQHDLNFSLSSLCFSIIPSL